MNRSLSYLISQSRARRGHLGGLESFVLDDQWDDARGWTGPLPFDAESRTEIHATDLIQRQFVERNVLGEVITRHRDAVLTREVAWTFGSSKRYSKELIAEAETGLTTWWDDSGVMDVLRDATRTLLFARETHAPRTPPLPARSPIRLFIKSRSLVGGAIPPKATLEEALACIGVHAAPPYQAGLIRNLDGDPVASYYDYTDDDGVSWTEICGVARDLAALDVPTGAAPDATVVRQDNDRGDVAQVAYDLGGNLLMFEMTREPLLTRATISQQKLINKAFSMMSHNLDIAGFTERTILNAQMPGHWVDVDGNPADASEGVRFIPDPMHVGAGAMNFLSGLREVMQDGSLRYVTPSVEYRDPVPPDAFIKSYEASRRAIYEETKQMHSLISGDAFTSGWSRVQAANDFVASLGPTATQIGAATRWLLTSALTLAALLMQKPGRYVSLRPSAQARISAVQLSPEDIRAEIEKRDSGLIATVTAMTRVGVEDPDAEQALIDAQPAKPTPPTTQAPALSNPARPVTPPEAQ